MKSFMPVARLPQSWFDLTNVVFENKIYAIENDKEELYITVTDSESTKTVLDDTRLESRYYIYQVANLLQLVLSKANLPRPRVHKWYLSLRRRINLEVLEEISIFLDERGDDSLAMEIDDLRARLSQLSLPVFDKNSGLTSPPRGMTSQQVMEEPTAVREARSRPKTLKEMGIQEG